jgi:signal transduction histidine kinase
MPSTPSVQTLAARTIVDLVTSDLCIDAAEPIPSVVRTWESHPGADGMAVLEGDHVRYLSRARFFLQLGKRFGYSVFEKKPVSLLSEEGSTVDAEMDPVEVISLATQREAERIYDDILVLERGRFRGLVSMRSLLVHHKGLLVNGIAERALLEEKNRQLRDLSRAQTELLDGLMLELRTPVNTMLAMVRALDGSTPEKTRGLLALGQDVMSILNELQDLSGLERGDLRLLPEVVDPRPLIEEIAGGGALAGGRPVRVDVRLPDLPAALVTDPLFLRRILANLVGAGRRLSGEETLTLRPAWDADALVLEMRYAGTSTDPESLPSLLARVSAQDMLVGRRLGGAAMRLATLASLLKLLGGAVSAGRDGDVTTLTVRVPSAAA